MKTERVKDERVITQQRKINSEAFGILFVLLLGAMIIQLYFLDAEPKQYAAELICLFIACVYIMVRHLTLGLDLFGEGKRAKYIPLLSSVVSGVIFTTITGVINYFRYAETYEDNIGLFIAMLAITFISMTLIVFVVLAFLSFLNKRKQAKIQEKLDEDE